MFELIEDSPVRSDCTQDFKVELDRQYTVREFIETVLAERKDEWGHIGIKDGHPMLTRSATPFGNPSCEYRSGSLLTNMPDRILDETIVKASASGGWTRMDYILEIKR